MWNQKRLYYEIILPFNKILESMEWQGFQIDIDKLHELKATFTSQLQAIESQIYSITGEFKISSSQQLAEVLYKKLKIPDYVDDFAYDYKKESWYAIKDKFVTPTGLPSTDIFSLKKARSVTNHPVLNLILQHKKISKILSTYIIGIEKLLTPDNRLQPDIFPLTAGGRISISHPPLLQLPSRSVEGRLVKQLFKAPPGYVLAGADYCGLELRFLAWLSNDRIMKPAFFEKNLDVHAITGTTMFRLTYDQMKSPEHKMKRFCSKTTNFLITYLGGYHELQNQILKYGDLFVDNKKCWEFINGYFQTYPDIKPFHNKILNMLIKDKQITNLFGRTRKFHDLDVNDRKQLNEYHKQAVSHYIQSSSTGDYGSFKTVRLDKELFKSGKYKGRFWLNFYDGTYSLVEEDKADAFVKDMKDILESAEDPVTERMPVEVSVGKTWYQLK
jgi:DNA polymerase-1